MLLLYNGCCEPNRNGRWGGCCCSVLFCVVYLVEDDMRWNLLRLAEGGGSFEKKYPVLKKVLVISLLFNTWYYIISTYYTLCCWWCVLVMLWSFICSHVSVSVFFCFFLYVVHRCAAGVCSAGRSNGSRRFSWWPMTSWTGA